MLRNYKKITEQRLDLGLIKDLDVIPISIDGTVKISIKYTLTNFFKVPSVKPVIRIYYHTVNGSINSNYDEIKYSHKNINYVSDGSINRVTLIHKLDTEKLAVLLTTPSQGHVMYYKVVWDIPTETQALVGSVTIPSKIIRSTVDYCPNIWFDINNITNQKPMKKKYMTTTGMDNTAMGEQFKIGYNVFNRTQTDYKGELKCRPKLTLTYKHKTTGALTTVEFVRFNVQSYDAQGVINAPAVEYDSSTTDFIISGVPIGDSNLDMNEDAWFNSNNHKYTFLNNQTSLTWDDELDAVGSVEKELSLNASQLT
tara:strand:- start:24213 stop:25145 length:933 start_codon:yes stop_codon:yes gene_type:complete